MPIWDPTLGLGDPGRLEAAEALLCAFDPIFSGFAHAHNAAKEDRRRGAPTRHVFAIDSDCVVRTIHIMPIIVQTGPLTTGRFCIDGSLRLDEGGTRITYWLPRRREYELAELKANLETILDEIWSEMNAIGVTELRRIGKRSKLWMPPQP